MLEAFFIAKLLKTKEVSGLSMHYRKPPTISPGLIFFRKRFLMGLYKGGRGLIYGGGLIHGRSFPLV
jgi:hypothetical protein